MHYAFCTATLLVVASLVLLDASASTMHVTASVETEPVDAPGDAADDMCFWVHPDDPAQSLLIGTNKQGSLETYTLDGRRVHRLSGMRPNNVDIRHALGNEGAIDLVAVSDRADNSIKLFRVDPDSRALLPALSGTGATGLEEIYGICLYRDGNSGAAYVIPNSKDGTVQVWAITFRPDGLAKLALEAQFHVGGQVEGCVADDQAGVLYIGEEQAAIWRYDLRVLLGGGDIERSLVDTVQPNGQLAADVEGLTLYLGEAGTGYLIASSQGNHSYVVYRRDGRNEYVGTFRITGSGTIDGTEDTDGIDVCPVDLGPGFAWGAFAAQDGANEPLGQNFKLVPWERIANAFDPPLSMSGADMRD